MDISTSRLMDLRLELETLQVEQTLARWRNYIYGDSIDLTQTYEGHENLFSQETVERIKEQREKVSGDEGQALLYFKLELYAEYIRRTVARHDEKIANTTANAEVEVGGESVPFRQLSRLLAHEEDYDRRQLIAEAAVPVLERLEPVFMQREKDVQAVALEFGYDGYVEFGERVRLADLNDLAQLVDEFVEETDDLYEGLLGEMAERNLNIAPVKLRRCDFPRMLRAVEWDRFFPADRLLSAAKGMMAGLGIDMKSQQGLKIYTEDWARKAPRSACFALRIPMDVRVAISPIGGLADYAHLFHEIGHGLHYVFTNQAVSELRRLGPKAVPQTFAFLMEDLSKTPAWLADATEMSQEEVEDLKRCEAFSMVFRMRRCGAMLAYERWLHADGVDPRDRYRELLSEAYGVGLDSSDSARYLANVEDLFAVVDRVRAWFLHAQLEAHLEDNWGETWYQTKDAGDFLKSLWATGTRHVAEDLAGLWGPAKLEARPLIQRVFRQSA